MKKLPKFKTLNYSAFENVFYEYCHENIPRMNNRGEEILRPITKEELDKQLLCSALDEYDAEELVLCAGEIDPHTGVGPGLSKAILNRFRTGKVEVYKRIKEAYMKPDAIEYAIRNFEDIIHYNVSDKELPFLIKQLSEIVASDHEITADYIQYWDTLLKEKRNVEYIANIYVYAVTRSLRILDIHDRPYQINASLELVLRELKAGRRTPMLEAAIDMLYHRCTKGIEDTADAVKLFYHDYKGFVLGLKDYEDVINPDYLNKYKIVKVAAVVFEMKDLDERKEPYDKATVLAKYGVDEDYFNKVLEKEILYLNDDIDPPILILKSMKETLKAFKKIERANMKPIVVAKADDIIEAGEIYLDMTDFIE